ncbi:MAG: LapA family protein [Salinisphaeraceae bacterium]|uniref:LapA family protein n=1 Tax=Spectribacter acetivorans TaxID=3075603 RepID=A0ABU3B498_9GAMM|nr:LapA family protein [Salinisphaera sp. P385]MDT0617277.1 LapA family protein [Salinisphaera sp. P385]
MLRLLRNLVLVAALVLGVTFGFFNFQLVTVDLLFSDARVPLVVVLILDFALGFAIALLLLLGRMMGLRRELAKTQRGLKDARTEIRNLRSMPIHDA